MTQNVYIAAPHASAKGNAWPKVLIVRPTCWTESDFTPPVYIDRVQAAGLGTVVRCPTEADYEAHKRSLSPQAEVKDRDFLND